MTVKVYAVVDSADPVWGDPGDHDEVLSLWTTKERAQAEVERLRGDLGDAVKVVEMEVQ
jgi:hypothetical protein